MELGIGYRGYGIGASVNVEVTWTNLNVMLGNRIISLEFDLMAVDSRFSCLV